MDDIRQLYPPQFTLTGNAGKEFQEFFQSAHAFARWAAAQSDVKVTWEAMVTGETVSESNSLPVVMGLRISVEGWQAMVYAEFVTHVLHKVPEIIPDGRLDINTMPNAEGCVLDFWHD